MSYVLRRGYAYVKLPTHQPPGYKVCAFETDLAVPINLSSWPTAAANDESIGESNEAQPL